MREMGLAAALKEWLTDEIQLKHDLITVLQDDEMPRLLSEDIKTLLFRSVRELVVNVVKHARAHKVVVTLRRDGDNIRIDVTDDGIGCDDSTVGVKSPKKGGYGAL